MIAEFERVLGTIKHGFAEEPGPGFQVTVSDLPETPDLSVYATLGLSNHDVQMPTGSTRIEFVCLIEAGCIHKPFPSLLYDVGEEVLRRHETPLRGDVIGPKNAFVEGTDFTALYVTSPVFLQEEDLTLRCEGQKPVVLIWLVPITTAEAEFVHLKGWRAFEDLLEQNIPSLVTLPRPSLV